MEIAIIFSKAGIFVFFGVFAMFNILALVFMKQAQFWLSCEQGLSNNGTPPNTACSRRVQGCGTKKYHPKSKVMVGRTRG
jgi:hypothetical protein